MSMVLAHTFTGHCVSLHRLKIQLPNLLIPGYIIGPVIFHEIVASQCQYTTDNCQKEKTCWYYDLPTLGLMLHGIVAVFLVAGTLLFIVMCVLLLPGNFVNPAEDSAKLALERVG